MTVDFGNIYTRLESLSAFEGGRAQDAQGESLFPVVHITEQDKPLLREYAGQCARQLKRDLAWLVKSATVDTATGGVTLTLAGAEKGLDSTRLSQDEWEYLFGSYALSQWLSDKLPERAKVWGGIYATALQSLAGAVTATMPALDEAEF